MTTPTEELTKTDCNCLALRQASRRVSQFYDQALAPAGIKTTQYSILNRIQRSGPTTVNELAARLVMDASTLTHNLRPLLNDGLVELLEDENDRRRRAVALTTRGRAVHTRARPLWLDAQARFETALGTNVSSALRKMLGAVVRAELESAPAPLAKSRSRGKKGTRRPATPKARGVPA